MQAGEGALRGADTRAAGSVRVTSVPLLVNRVLIPALPALLNAHPDLRIDLVADPHDLSLTDREADIALRLARPRKETRVITRRVGFLAYAVYASADLAPDSGLPWIDYDDRLADLPQNRWIAERGARAGAAHDGQ